MRRILLCLVVILAATGCTERKAAMKTLALADSLVWTQPDSALRLVESVDRRHIRGDEAQALYGLVYSEVLNRNNIIIRSDSLLRDPLRYYKSHGTAYDKARVLFYAANVDYERGDEKRAIEQMTRIEEHYIPQVESSRFRGLFYAKLAYYYSYDENDEKSLQMADMAIEEYRRCGYNKGVNDMLTRKARTYMSLGRHKDGLALLNSARDRSLGEDCLDTATLLYINSLYAYSYAISPKKADKLEAKRILFEGFGRYNRGVIDSADYSLLGTICLGLEQFDSTIYYYNKVFSRRTLWQTSCRMYIDVSLAEYQLGNRDAAYNNLAAAYNLTDSMRIRERGVILAELAERYRTSELRLANEKLRNQKIYLGAGILVILLVGVYLWLRIRSKNKQIENEAEEMIARLREVQSSTESRYIEVITSLESDSSNEAIENVRRVFEYKLNDSRKMLELANAYADNPQEFYRQFVKYNESNKMKNREFMQKLEDAVNWSHCGVLSWFRKNYDSPLSDTDVVVFAMSALGFSTQDMAFACGYKNEKSIYQARFRMRKGLGLVALSLDLDEYIDVKATELKVNGHADVVLTKGGYEIYLAAIKAAGGKRKRKKKDAAKERERKIEREIEMEMERESFAATSKVKPKSKGKGKGKKKSEVKEPMIVDEDDSSKVNDVKIA